MDRVLRSFGSAVEERTRGNALIGMEYKHCFPFNLAVNCYVRIMHYNIELCTPLICMFKILFLGNLLPSYRRSIFCKTQVDNLEDMIIIFLT